jgi:hypothetical protein
MPASVNRFCARYKKAFERIEQKYYINGKAPSVAAHEIIETIIKSHEADKSSGEPRERTPLGG